jgi:hypothetical protein
MCSAHGTFHDWSTHQGRALCETTSVTWRFLQPFLKRFSRFTNSRVAYFGFLMRNGSSNASIDGYKGPTLDWWAAKCSVDMVSPKTTRTDAIRSPIKAIGMADTRSVLSIKSSCLYAGTDRSNRRIADIGHTKGIKKQLTTQIGHPRKSHGHRKWCRRARPVPPWACLPGRRLEHLLEVFEQGKRLPNPQPRSTAVIPCPNRTGVLPAGIPAITLAVVRSRRHCA